MPERGGRYYANYIASRCHSVAALAELPNQSQPETPEKTGDHVAMIAAFDKIRRVCGQFTKDDFGLWSEMKRSDMERDILFSASAALQATSGTHPSDNDARQKALSKILELGDPLLIDRIGIGLSISRDQQGTFLYFDGKKEYVYTGPPLMAAYYLLPCGIGLGCSVLQDMDLTMMCATGAACYADRFAKTLAVDAGGDPIRYGRILDSYAALLSAIKGKEVQSSSCDEYLISPSPAIGYFPIQKRLKISPSRSSGVNAPVISPSASCARRSSSASRSSAASASCRVRLRAQQVVARAAQRLHMARARDEHAVGLGVPAGEFEQRSRAARRGLRRCCADSTSAPALDLRRRHASALLKTCSSRASAASERGSRAAICASAAS